MRFVTKCSLRSGAWPSIPAQRLEATGATLPPDFEGRLITSVIESFPSEDELRQRLRLRFQVGVIFLGSEMLREQRLAAEERRLIERIEAESRVERLRLNVEERAVQQQMWADEKRVRLRVEAEAEDRKREAEVKERIHLMKIEAAREKLQETLSSWPIISTHIQVKLFTRFFYTTNSRLP